MSNDTKQLNHFSNIDLDDSRPSGISQGVSSSFKKVNFNTLSEDYATSEAYKTLRTNIFFCGSNMKTILLTSCDENEGKSTISAELVKALAESGKKSLLIDADMRKSTMLRKSLRVNEVTGLSEVLSGLENHNNVIFHTQIPNFDVIFAGHFPPNPVELIGNGVFSEVLNELKNVYDYIIIDSPPLGVVIDAAVISSFCDGAVLIIGAGMTNKKSAYAVCEQIKKSGCKLLGAIINQTSKSRLYRKKYYSKEYKKR